MYNKLFIILTAVFIIGFANYTVAGEYEKSTIQVNGDGEIYAEPDVGYITVSVETSSKSASDAVRINADKSQKVINKIKEIISGRDKVKTTNYSLYPVYEYDKTRKSQYLKEYRAVNEVLVETYDLKNIGKLIDATTTLGANRINGPRFDISNSDEIRRRALAIAVKDAKLTADTVAQASGTKIIKILRISPSYSRLQPYYNRGYMAESVSDKSAPTPIEPGELKISANVNIIYEIE